MWFRNLHFYRLCAPFAMDAVQLDAALRARKARPCGQLEEAVEGWSPPLGREGQMLAHEASGAMMICLERQERLLPACVVRDEWEARIEQQEAKDGRKLNRREKAEIKEAVIRDLLPRAFVRRSHTHACLLPGDGWLLIDAASRRRAEALLALLQKTIPALAFEVPALPQPLCETMRHWMLDESSLPEGFALEDACTLKSQGDHAGVIACRQEDLGREEILAHVRAGKGVSKLALNWRECVSFVLDEDVALKRMRFSDALMEEARSEAGEDARARFDVDFVLMSQTLRDLLRELMQACSVSHAEPGGRSL